MAQDAQPDIPENAEDITVEWVNAVFHYSGALPPTTHVTAVSKDPFAVGIGMMSRMYRLTLGYTGPDPHPPEVVILKLSSGAAGLRGMAKTFHLYERECLFYEKNGGTDKALGLPKIYANLLGPDISTTAIIMEDVGEGSRQTDQIEGASVEEAKIVLGGLAAFHALHWGKYGELPVGQPLFYGDGDLITGPFKALLGGVQKPLEAYPEEFEGGHRERVLLLVDKFLDLWGGLVGRKLTLQHGDSRLDNMFFHSSTTKDSPPSGMYLIDWQGCQVGNPAMDVGYFLSQSLETDVRRGSERELLRYYHDALCRGGVTGYDWYTFEKEYRLGSALAAIVPLGTRGASKLEDIPERSRRLKLIITSRALASLEEAEELLRQG